MIGINVVESYTDNHIHTYEYATRKIRKQMNDSTHYTKSNERIVYGMPNELIQLVETFMR